MRDAIRRLSTFSIVGRCERTGQLGVAVTTADVGAGRLITFAAAGVGAVAVQSWPNVYSAIDAVHNMGAGMSCQQALETVTRDDPDRELRQFGMVDTQGDGASWTGSDCTEWAGHVTGPGFAAQGNMLVGPETVDELARVFCEDPDDDLATRLLNALAAGQAAGGDKRGRQCAALYVVDTEDFPLWDLRVDENPDPVRELQRIYPIARTQLLPFVEGLPTRANPRGSLSEEFISMNLLPPPQRPGGGGAGPATDPSRPDSEREKS
jgi:uncharacterized Ntn-hydrolase superfamily protein